jgi:hypothetical protein
MFLRYSIKISSWLLLTVASFNFDMYQFSNDLFILLFYKRWSGRIPQTTKVSIHNLPFFFQLTKIDTHKNNWIHSNRIYYNKWCVIAYFVCVYVRTEMCTNNKFVSTLIWKRCFQTDLKMSRSIVLIFIYLWCFNATFNNISAISWRPVCMSDEYASDNVSRKRF